MADAQRSTSATFMSRVMWCSFDAGGLQDPCRVLGFGTTAGLKARATTHDTRRLAAAAWALESGRARDRHHDRLGHISIAGGNRAKGAESRADDRALGRGRHHHPLR